MSSSKTKRISPYLLTSLTLLLVALMAFTCACNPATEDLSNNGDPATTTPFIKVFDKEFKNVNLEDYFDTNVVQQLPTTVKDGDYLSVILSTKDENVLDAYDAMDTNLSLQEYFNSEEAVALRRNIDSTNSAILADLSKKGVSFEKGVDYYTLLSGKEIVIKAKDFYDVCNIVGDRAEVIVSEVYETEAYKNVLVSNTVNVYDTGIFNSSNFQYQGEGTVVAVLDTGLDYYHTAFSTDNFTANRDKLGMKFEDVASVVDKTVASSMQAGLTASDVYISEKVPFAFDYADGDSDVYPLYSNHGTHVAGVIAGKDDVITGVAPQAQLAIMKIFSDVDAQARASWILRALEDCVIIDVDIINMSIGTSCGFSRETDKEAVNGVYDRIRARGINMVVAASNSFNSTYNSEKNGNLGLTSNPDSATVSSPSTYKGALSIASINGAKTSYILYEDQIIYFVESTNRVAEEKNFVDDILKDGEDEKTVEYITIPGVGRTADYTGIDVTGKIALIARGSNTFEEKANIAQKQGALGAIVYNNVSGDIRMNVGDTSIAVCSISQDEGELLASKSSGTITISRSQASGPFMSDFSSWGPSPDLEIKPELTAHGGNILSAVPGQDYDEISGTSMATPNVSGLTALIRQYVKESPYFASIANDDVQVSAMVNRLLMSTADVVYNTNGLPYSVRKQGSGLANVVDAASTGSVIYTYKNGELMDKSKVELGDDPLKTGVYEFSFDVYNFSDNALSYDLSTIVMTEGVSETKTNQGETTVTEDGFILEGAQVVINSVVGGTQNGQKVSVNAGATATVTMTITLTDANKKYLDDSFANGMYVEGFVTLKGLDGATDIGFPYLAFYGDWTVAPLFDLDYFATNKDELDESIDLLDKTLPDAYASRPVGGVYADYVSFLGTYYFEQKPGSTMISADRKYISLSNTEGAINKLSYAWMGMLRNAREIDITIVDDATGEVVFSKTEKDIRKSYGDGGPIYPAQVRIGFAPADYNLPNNSTYTVTLNGRLDYGDGGVNTNLNNTFTFPLMVDFQAPVVEDVEFYTEYDKTEKKNRLFAKIAVYDNHYSMAALVGTISATTEAGLALNGFDHYMTPIYSSFNNTSYITYELTEHLGTIKNGYDSIYKVYGATEAKKILTSPIFTISLYDYALNNATYEIALPNKFIDGYFNEETIVLSPNETYNLEPVVYPATEWTDLIEYTSSNDAVAKVLPGTNKLIGLSKGLSLITASYKDVNGNNKEFTTEVEVLGENDPGYRPFDEPVVHKFEVVGYHTNKAYYKIDSTEREIGQTGDDRTFPNRNSLNLTLYPSESVTLRYDMIAYFPARTTLEFSSSNEDIVKIDALGTLTAQKEGFASISVKVLKDGESTYYSKNISISVEDPYITSGPTLTNYYGLGGSVVIPSSLAITEIGTFAFSNFDYVEKTEDDRYDPTEDPELTKQWFIGDNTITEVIIPEGVETISAYAFANLTALKSVTFPSTLTTISYGAFYGCTSLTNLNGIQHVKFINQNAFAFCDITGTLAFDKTIAVADNAFAYNIHLKKLVLSKHTQSVGQYAFVGNEELETLTINAEKIKLGQYAFADCSALKSVSVNAAVIPTGLFDGCTSLESITLGKDVAVIGEYAFNDTAVTSVTVADGNTTFYPVTNKPYLLNKAENGTILTFVAPAYSGEIVVSESTVTTIGPAALSGNKKITSFRAPSVTIVKDYAFAGCENLAIIELGTLTEIGKAAFMRTAITQAHSFDGIINPTEKGIGSYAYYGSKIQEVTIPNGMKVGDSAFEECRSLATIVIGDSVKIGANAFKLNWQLEDNWVLEAIEDIDSDVKVCQYDLLSELTSLTIGKDVTIGSGAFYGASSLTTVTLGTGAYIGDQAFYNTEKLTTIDLSGATHIGKEAFSGVILSIVYGYVDIESGKLVASKLEPPKDADGNYRYTIFTNKLQSVTINAETVDSDAFAYNELLEEVTLGNNTLNINNRAFASCTALHTINLDNVVNIGTEAFAQSKLNTINLSSAVNVGEFAFIENESLTQVTFGANIDTLGEGAFSYSKALTTLNGEEKIKNVGDYAFAYTAINNVDLSGVVNLGSHAFLKETMSAFTVKLGNAIEKIGDNPFANCDVQGQFSTVVYTEFNGVKYDEISYTYDLSENVKIIDGSIYRVVPFGYELITFASPEDYNVVLADNTVRISAMAFMGSDVVNVSLPHTVASIGHKAFYDCNKLTIVTMQSYDAPVLEEEFDMIYATSGENAPMSDKDAENYGWDGLGIVDFYMWNMWDSQNQAPVFSNFYYGANFVNYVGKVDRPIVLVYPVNGQNYDSFVMNQYFSVHIMGAAAADDVTLEAIKIINALPETIQLTDKALVQKAREAYDKIASYEQRALVANYQKLTDAELRIKTLENLANGGEGEAPDEEPVVEEGINVPAMILSIVFGSVGVLGAIAFVLYLYFTGKLKFPKKKKATVKPLIPGANQKVVKKMVKKVVRRVVVYNPDTDDVVEVDDSQVQINQQNTETEIIPEEDEDNE